MTSQERDDLIRQMLVASTIASGVPLKLEDSTTLAKVARMSVRPEQEGEYLPAAPSRRRRWVASPYPLRPHCAPTPPRGGEETLL
jgi:hypothetical protein